MKQFAAAVLSILSCLILPTVNAGNGRVTPDPYTLVQSVTQEEIDRIEQLKRDRPEGLRYGMMYSDESFIASDGTVGGFTRLLCRHLSTMFGIAITPEVLGWDALVEGLDNRTIDLSGELTATPQRRKKYRLTTPIAERTFTVYRNAAKPELDLINSGEPLAIGFLRNSLTYDQVQETCEIPFISVFLDNYRQAAEAILSGEVDGFISEGMMDAVFEKSTGITFQKYYPLTFTTVSLGSANPDVFPLLDVFQKYLDHGGREQLFELYSQGHNEYLRHKLHRQFTSEEKAFIADHMENNVEIPVAAEFDNYPASFYNWQEKEWQGVAHDILQQAGSLTGLRFTVVSRPDEPWHSVLESLQSGKTHIITHLAKSKDRKGNFLWLSEPYMTDQYALLSSSDTEDIPINRVRNCTVGLVEGTAYSEAFRRVFPHNDNVRMFSNTIEAFKALDRGDVELVMMTRNLLLSATNFMERPEFKVNIPLELPCDSYLGLNKDQPVLHAILDKAHALIDKEQIADRWRRKVFDYNKKISQAQVPYLLGMTLLLLAVLGLVIHLFTVRIAASNRLSMTDHLTRLPNRRGYDTYLRDAWEKSIKARDYISLLTLDVDHFKQFNDTYGHQQGDVILQAIGTVLKNTIHRTGDMAARVGGEEFAVILPNTDSLGAVRVAEIIRTAIEKTTVPGPDDTLLQVTVSIGAASIKPGPDDQLHTFQCRSDDNLYRAKHEGRNRVCCAADAMCVW